MRPFALVLAVLLAACGGSEDGPRPDPGPAGMAAGPGVPVEEALAADSSEPLLVNGNLLAEGGEVRLCEALAESFPPQCVGAALRVEGLKLQEVDGLVSEGAVSWSDRPVQLLGTVEDGTLTVSQNATS